jgi:acyl-CoA synthetase (AMP-forming)/AMP-acid ligase II/enoyl-CoA hydratase/carnithine racemase
MEPSVPEPTVLVSHHSQSIAKITLNRPKSLNALNVDLLKQLVDALRTAHEAGKRIIILEGAGERSFCAGEDLKESLAPKTGSAEELRVAFTKLQDITRLTSSSEALVIAAVHGYAIGGGAEIALAADFVIGGPEAKIRFPEVPIGHAATGGITLRLTQMVGLLKAKELLIRGQLIAAKEALTIGLLSELVDDPKARAMELAHELEKLPATSATNTKASLERLVFPNMEAALADEVNVASYCFAQSDAAQAFENFASRSHRKNAIANNAVSNTNGEIRTSPQTANLSPNSGPTPAGKSMVEFLRTVKDINSAFNHAVEEYGPRTFLRIAGEDLSFQKIDTSVGLLAGGLQALGVVPGERVLVMMRNSVDMVNTWLATNRLGAVWVPINVELKSVTLKHVISAAEARVAIVDQEFTSDFRNAQADQIRHVFITNEKGSAGLPALYGLGAPVTASVPVKPSTTAAFLYTSGTTGKSKPCVLSHQYFILQASALVETFGLHGSDVLYCPFPLFHADATALTTIPAILLGAVASISSRFSASKFWDEIRQTGATVYDFMGATLALTYKQTPSHRDRDHNVRLAWGVPIPNFAADYEKRFGHPLCTLYGSVEASLPIMQHGQRVNGSCGTIRRGYQLRIANDMDEPVPANTTGHLLLRSDIPNAFFEGYFNNHVATVESFSNLWLHTGDLAKVDEQGNVYFVGRVKDVIRRRGENINASEIEEELLRHPDIVTAAAFAIPSELGSGTEDDVKVAVKLREGSIIHESDLFDWTVRNLARFQVPRVIEIVTEIKKTPTGKIEKGWLCVEGGKRFDIRKEKANDNGRQ